MCSLVAFFQSCCLGPVRRFVDQGFEGVSETCFCSKFSFSPEICEFVDTPVQHSPMLNSTEQQYRPQDGAKTQELSSPYMLEDSLVDGLDLAQEVEDDE